MADFGSGRTGNFVFPAAKIVGEKGSVYAVDIMKESLQGIAKRAGLDATHNIHTVWADIEKPKSIAIPEKSLDVVFLINFLSAVKKDDAVLAEADRLVKEGGRILIVDWIKTTLSFAPTKEELVNWDDVLRWSELHGYKTQTEFPVGPYHKGLVFKKSESL